MWPAEGAVSESTVPIFARRGVRWIATDRGVLARSGRWGYDVNSPDVLCQPYRAEAGREAIAVFFRDTQLSDHIGFHYQGYDDYGRAAREFLGEIKERFARRVQDDADRILTVVLDGENAWGAYREDARPFLHALYDLLESDPETATVSFTEYLDGDPARGIAAHPQETLAQVHNLFTASWIDENGSLPGVDLGTTIGEAEENRAWELLGQTRDALARANVTPETAPAAFEAVCAAEGSDWFWWFGEDQESGHDEEFDELFRLHLKNVYRGLNAEPPAALDQPIVAHPILWTLTQPVQRVQAGGRLTVRTNCPGVLTWQVDDGETRSSPLVPAGGAMAGETTQVSVVHERQLPRSKGVAVRVTDSEAWARRPNMRQHRPARNDAGEFSQILIAPGRGHRLEEPRLGVVRRIPRDAEPVPVQGFGSLV